MMKLELESITKFYGKYPALQNVSATLTEGVYGLLGPNGAGKTTLINILIGILPASGGVIHLDGENTVQMGGRYFDQIGYMPQYPQFYANFTVQEFLDYMCQVKGVANAKESIDAALVFVNLEENRSKRIGALSGGMRQRLGIAQAILNDPKLLVLDEPTAGLDPGEPNPFPQSHFPSGQGAHHPFSYPYCFRCGIYRQRDPPVAEGYTGHAGHAQGTGAEHPGKCVGGISQRGGYGSDGGHLLREQYQAAGWLLSAAHCG